MGTFNSIKKTQAEMKVTLSDIKQKLGNQHGVDEADKSMIWNIRKQKTTNQKNNNKKRESTNREIV